ncbi:MAG: phosphatase PAP2 family protein, partial [Nocardioidaceae bacterium]
LNQWLTAHPTLSNAAAWYYQMTHLAVTLTVLALTYVIAPRLYRRARSALVLCNVIALVIFFVLPVMPPRLLPGYGFVDSSVLAGFYNNDVGPVHADLYGAMPSLHVAWALWVSMTLFLLLRKFPWRWVVFVYAATTTVVVLATANHYVLDVLAGMLVTLCAFVLAGLHPAVSRSAAPRRVPAWSADQSDG